MYLYFYPIPRKTVWEGFNGVIHCPYVFFQAIHLNALLTRGVRLSFSNKKSHLLLHLGNGLPLLRARRMSKWLYKSIDRYDNKFIIHQKLKNQQLINHSGCNSCSCQILAWGMFFQRQTATRVIPNIFASLF